VLAHFASATQRRSDLVRQLEGEVSLTERETEVLQRVAKGYTLPEIAQQFGLSRHTIADHIKQVYRKLNVSSRAEAALEAARRGLVKP
jgi:DNA-binding CsgD family transcriptional regulator